MPLFNCCRRFNRLGWVGSLGALLFLSGCSSMSDADRQWATYTRAAVIHYEQGDLDKAEALFLLALQVSEEFPPEDPRIEITRQYLQQFCQQSHYHNYRLYAGASNWIP